MPSGKGFRRGRCVVLKQDVILQIEGNLKAFLKLEMGITRGGLPARPGTAVLKSRNFVG
jgi:hypothetical protein